MASTLDTSIFAWGSFPPSTSYHLDSNNEPNLSRLSEYLLASAPSAFRSRVYYLPVSSSPMQPYSLSQRKKAQSRGSISPDEDLRWRSSPFAQGELPHWSLTGYGVQCHFPVIELESLNLAIMVLLVEREDQHVGLLLTRSPYFHDPSRPLYFAGGGITDTRMTPPQSHASTVNFARLIALGTDLASIRIAGYDQPIQVNWKTIYIVPYPSQDVVGAARSAFPLNWRLATPFSMPRWLVSRIYTLGFNVLVTCSSLPGVIRLRHPKYSLEIRIALGLCVNDTTRSGIHWAQVHVRILTDVPGLIWQWFPSRPDREHPGAHDCNEHHVDKWTARSREFTYENTTVLLTFLPNTWSMPGTEPETMDIHIELEGGEFDKILQDANARIPSVQELERTGPSDETQAEKRLQETAQSSRRAVVECVEASDSKPTLSTCTSTFSVIVIIAIITDHE